MRKNVSTLVQMVIMETIKQFVNHVVHIVKLVLGLELNIVSFVLKVTINNHQLKVLVQLSLIQMETPQT